MRASLSAAFEVEIVVDGVDVLKSADDVADENSDEEDAVNGDDAEGGGCTSGKQ